MNFELNMSGRKASRVSSNTHFERTTENTKVNNLGRCLSVHPIFPLHPSSQKTTVLSPSPPSRSFQDESISFAHGGRTGRSCCSRWCKSPHLSFSFYDSRPQISIRAWTSSKMCCERSDLDDAERDSIMEKYDAEMRGYVAELLNIKQDTNLVDNSETVYISSLALLKMLRHGRAGVPMEVMGLMLGEFVDDYTVKVVDVFAMPQSGTGVSVEAVDPVFQTKMMDMLKQTGRHETVVGWYHSHPGFGCWLSSVDISTQQSFESLTARAVAVVVDPIQSVKGKVVIDAFRLINPQTLMLGQEPRQTTSNLGHLNKPSIQALIHGLNRHYYSIGINYRKTGLEENMLMNLHKHVWTEALQMSDFKEEGKHNEDRLKRLVGLAEGYEKRVKEETELTKDQLKTRYVGKLDPKKRKSTLAIRR